MAIGNAVQQAGLNANLGNAAIAVRDAALAAVNLWSYVLSLGADQAAQIAALQGLGFTAADANNFWTAANRCFALSQVYYGNQAQPAFNFDSALAIARGAS